MLEYPIDYEVANYPPSSNLGERLKRAQFVIKAGNVVEAFEHVYTLVMGEAGRKDLRKVIEDAYQVTNTDWSLPDWVQYLTDVNVTLFER